MFSLLRNLLRKLSETSLPPWGAATVLLIAVWRCVFLIAALFILDGLFDLGTSPYFLALGVTIGTIASSRLAFTPLSHSGYFLLLTLGFGLYRALIFLAHLLPPSWLPSIFSLASLELHLNLFFLALAGSATLAWGFWRTTHVLTAEALLLVFGAVWLISGHRNFHFDRPQIVNSLAWTFGVSPLVLLVAVGAAAMVSIGAFLLASSLPGSPIPIPGAPQVRLARGSSTRGGILAALGLTAFVVAIVAPLTWYGFSLAAYGEGGRGLTSEGVGQENREEMTPLGFHSALGGSKEPAAVVRLEGDYKENPFLPMLYFRESALSSFNGREMVIARDEFDQDVNRTAPEQPFQREADSELSRRTAVTQSIYLLANHKLAFALDYPIAIRQLKNTNPGRFRGAYRVYSMAPAFNPSELAGMNVGDPRWHEATRAHYLSPHPDYRYAELAQKITGGLESPIAKAQAITDFFSKNAIYTLSPGHEVGENDDPVAPFLFGDMRGYCVHFAHAMVYMMRAVGIPARIGTGYLTDFSQSKDGHILLRTSDRHAWSEVFIEGIGWYPFDPQPERVESHADSPVDMKMLEELMGLLDPGEEILPEDAAKGEAGLEEEKAWKSPPLPVFLVPLGFAIILIFGTKLYLLYGWRLTSEPRIRLRRYYRSAVALLYDAGFRRSAGETREEFRKRVAELTGRDILRHTPAVNELAYAQEGTPGDAFDPAPVANELPLTRLQKALVTLNPASAVAMLSGYRW